MYAIPRMPITQASLLTEQSAASCQSSSSSCWPLDQWPPISITTVGIICHQGTLQRQHTPAELGWLLRCFTRTVLCSMIKRMARVSHTCLSDNPMDYHRRLGPFHVTINCDPFHWCPCVWKGRGSLSAHTPRTHTSLESPKSPCAILSTALSGKITNVNLLAVVLMTDPVHTFSQLTAVERLHVRPTLAH